MKSYRFSIILILSVILGAAIGLGAKVQIDHFKTSEQIVKAFTAPDFTEILSKRNMLALIVFSILVGLGTAAAGSSNTTATGNERKKSSGMNTFTKDRRSLSWPSNMEKARIGFVQEYPMHKRVIPSQLLSQSL